MINERIDQTVAKAGAGMAQAGGVGAFLSSWLASNQWIFGLFGLIIGVIGLVIQFVFGKRRDKRERDLVAKQIEQIKRLG